VGVIHPNHSHNSSNCHNHHHSPLQQLKQDFNLHRASQALKDLHQLVLSHSSQVLMDSHHLSLFLPQLRHMCHLLLEVHKVSLRPILHIPQDHSILILDILNKAMDLKLILPHLHKVDINIQDLQLLRCHLLDHRVLHIKVSMVLMTRVGFLDINRHHSNLKSRT